MIKVRIYLPGGSLYNIGYNGLKDLGYPIEEFWGCVIIKNMDSEDLPILMKRLNELEHKCLEYKMCIHWDENGNVTELRTKHWSDL